MWRRCTRRPLVLHEILACSLVLCLVVGGCQPAHDRPTEVQGVVLVVVDTLRSDRVWAQGQARGVAPRIREIGLQSTRYPHALATSPWTLPTHASMFTGRLPAFHRAHGYWLEEPQQNAYPLGSNQETLAEVLRANGFTTAAFVANAGFLARHWGLDQGFDTYEVEWQRGDAVAKKVEDWLDTVRPPFFLFVNLMDAHRPYNTSPVPGLLEEPAVRDGGELLDELIEHVKTGSVPPEDLRQKVIDQYDTGVANADAAVGRIVDALDRQGFGDFSLVVITSDHGEYFGEHGLVEHSKDIYQEALAVPLILRPPVGQRRPVVVDERIMSHDVPRLIADYMPESVASEMRRRLVPAGGHPPIAELYFTRAKDLLDPVWGHRFRRIRRAAFRDQIKLIVSSDGQDELYDLENDPGESNNLIHLESELALGLRGYLEKVGAVADARIALESDTPLLVDEEVEQQLEALGYGR